MNLTFKKEYDLTSNTLQHRIVLDTIELLKEKKNFTEREVNSVVFLAILQNICEEDVAKLVEESEEELFDIYEKFIEPKVLEALNSIEDEKDRKDYTWSLTYDVMAYKTREIDMNGKFFYAVQELLKLLSEMDTEAIAGLITSASFLKNNTINAAKEEVKKIRNEENVEVASEKIQELINKARAAV